MFVGILLLILGVLLLLEQLGIIQTSAWGLIWPIALIALGASMVFRHTKNKDKHIDIS